MVVQARLLFESAAEHAPPCPRPHRRLTRPGLTMTLGLPEDNINISLVSGVSLQILVK